MRHKTKFMAQLASYLAPFNLVAISTVQMWELFLIGFVAIRHIPHLKNVQVNYKATGIANIVGNKGGL